MMSTLPLPLLVAGVVIAVFLGYAVFAPVAMNLSRFIRPRRVLCPVHNLYGTVRLNALEAALTSGYGQETLHVRGCSLLHPGEKCGETCLGHDQADSGPAGDFISPGILTEHPVKPPGSFIHYLG